MVPEPQAVMEEVENNYNYTCRLTVDETIDSVDVDVDFVVEDVPPNIVSDIAMFVSVRGYQAYVGEVDVSEQTGTLPISRKGESE